MTRRLPIVLALLAAIVVFAPRPAPLYAPYAFSAAPTYRTQIGAPSIIPPSPRTMAEAEPSTAPHPTGGIGLPASAVNPDYTAPPDPPVTPASIRGGGVTGTATFYKYHPGQAAAARLLREHYGSSWRGAVVTVSGPAGQAVVTLSDYESSTIPGRLIDLDASDFQRVCGALSRGTCEVEIVP